MPATLTTLIARARQALFDVGATSWSSASSDASLTEAVRQALHEYSLSLPVYKVGTVTLSASVRDVDLSTLTGLIEVFDVHYPYSATAEQENVVGDWKLERRSTGNFLYMPLKHGYGEPASGLIARVWYGTWQTLNGLDSAVANTFPDDHETPILWGMLGYAATLKSIDLVETAGYGTRPTDNFRMEGWGQRQLREFRAWLRIVSAALLAPREGGDRWRLDKWDDCV